MLRSDAGTVFLQRFVGEADLGGRLALFGSVGERAFANSLHALECAREARAAW